MGDRRRAVIESFGHEWTRFDQSSPKITSELEASFHSYFSIFPWSQLPDNSSGFDMGCGTGRWSQFVAPRVGRILCIDPSSALHVAKSNLSSFSNVRFLQSSIEELDISERFDFGFSLGVLHHVEDTQQGFNKCAALLKPGAPFLAYLYYRFDNRPFWFRAVWKASDILRRTICRLPPFFKNSTCDGIAVLIYWPLSRVSLVLEKVGLDVSFMPLNFYRSRNLYTLRTDALDRFGTQLEKRFTKAELKAMMLDAGFERIEFKNGEPYWCVIGYKV